jgi:hypothetical protein
MLPPKSALGPDFKALRPLHPSPTSLTFPVYEGLTDRLLTADDPDDTVRHVLAVCSGYAYSDQTTVATMMTRLGLERSRCVMVREVVDAMFICSTAFVIQSEDGRVVIVCYRGTEPASLINWLTDLDIDPGQVRYDLTSQSGDESYRVHAGFYRNVRATRFAVIEVLQRAMQGQSIFPDDDQEKPVETETIEPLQTLYVTGHSLGAAMATMMTVMLRAKGIYAPLAAKLKATYTYGQPMIGTPAFATACTQATFGGTSRPLDSALFRYVYADDLVPQLPPRESGEFAHFGQEFRCERLDGDDENRPTWARHMAPTRQTGALGLAVGGLALVTREIKRLRRLPLHQSVVDHGPQNYIAALTPPHIRSEFGD